MFVICALASLILYFVSVFGNYNLSSGVILAPLAAYFVLWILAFMVVYLISKLFDK